jgi:hypothetical protein
MELLNVLRARSIWLFDINDLNPHGKRFGPEMLSWLKETYKFTKIPSSVDDLDETKALAFLNGGFQVSPENTIVVELKIYTDGFVADTRSSTKDTDRFIDDVLSSAAKQFDLVYRADIIRNKLYLSELNVRYKGSLQTLNPKMQAFTDKISHLINGKVELCGMGFWAEQKTSGPFSPFRFERKIDAPFSQQRYYSAAPLPTQEHLGLLEELEKVLSA